MLKKLKKPQIGSLTRAGLILNIVLCSIGLLGYFIGVVFIGIVIAGLQTFINRGIAFPNLPELNQYTASVLIVAAIILIVIFLIQWGLAIASLIVSIRTLNGHTISAIAAGVLGILTGFIIAGILILVGNYNDKQELKNP